MPVYAKLVNSLLKGDALLEHPTLKKLLKHKALAALLSQLETLSGTDGAFSVYDLDGQLLAGTAQLSTAMRNAILAAPEEKNLGATALQVSTQALLANGARIGVLISQNDKALENDPSGVVAHLLNQVIDQALQNRALAQETLERYREINLLYRVQEIIGAQLDLAQITSLIVNESIRVIQATAGALLLLTPDGLAFDFFRVQDQEGQTPIATHCPTTDTIAGWVVQNQRPVIVNDPADEPRCGPADAGATSLLCVPLTNIDQHLGALVLYDKSGRARPAVADTMFTAGTMFTASDQKLLTALASQAAIAIETAREVEARENRLKAQIRELRIEIDEIRKQRQVDSVTATDYFAHLQQTAQEMRREFEEGL